MTMTKYLTVDQAITLARRVVERSESLSLDSGRDRERLMRALTEAYLDAPGPEVTPTQPVSIPEVLTAAKVKDPCDDD